MNKQEIKKRRLPVVLRWIGWILIVQLVLFNASAAIYAYRLTHFYRDKPVGTVSANIFSKTWKLFTGPRLTKMPINTQPLFPFENVSLRTGNGLAIETWYGASDAVAKGTVIFVHGIGGNKSLLLHEAHECWRLGFNVMLVDLRGHGQSAGNSSSIGYFESEEIKLAYDYIKQKGEKNIFLYGVSLGSVVIARAMFEYQLQPRAIILDMPFASLQTYLENKARTLGFPEQPFAFFTTFWIGIEKGYNGYRHRTERYIKSLQCPVLMQWGKRDWFIHADEANRIFAAIGSGNKKFVTYDNAGHESFLLKEPSKWHTEMEDFLQ